MRVYMNIEEQLQWSSVFLYAELKLKDNPAHPYKNGSCEELQ